MFIVAVIISLLGLGFILYPLSQKEVIYLDGFSSYASVDQLKNLQMIVLKKYLEEEEAYKEQLISKRTWDKRQEFLARRYIDITRRLDFAVNS